MIQALYVKNKILLEKHLRVKDSNNESRIGRNVFIYPFGLCMNIFDYDPNEQLILTILSRGIKQNFSFEEMFVFITDPAMLTFSSIDLHSHQFTQIIGLKKGHNVIYTIQVELKDYDNPAERNSCSSSSYSDCLEEKYYDLFSKVMLENFKILS